MLIECRANNLVHRSGTGNSAGSRGVDCKHWRYIARKLAKAGLLTAQQRRTLGKFVTQYKAGKQWKRTSVSAFAQCEKLLADFFGNGTPLEKITADKAADFRIHLVKSGLAEASVAKRIGQCKALFSAARRRGLLAVSPFEEVKSGSQVNNARHYFVTVKDATALIDACNNPQQRLIIALARWGGL
jgi:site-specific recombinase XerD